MERWADVAGYEGLYRVSDMGSVWSCRRNRRLRPGPMGRYVGVTLYKDGQPRGYYVHRLVASAFLDHGDGTEVNHLNGVKNDNRAENLEWCTSSENSKHAFAMQLCQVPPSDGENNPRAKLTREQVEEIRRVYDAGGVRHVDLAAAYGVSHGCIGEILRGATWT